MFNFQWPWLIILLPLPWLIYRFWPMSLQHRQVIPEIRLPYVQAIALAFQHSQPVEKKAGIKRSFWLLALAWLGLTLTLMYPQWLDKTVEVKKDGYDLMLALDLSGSMRYRDFVAPDGTQLDRLQAAKTVLDRFIQYRQGDRVGLVLFADHAHLQAPLTLDIQAIRTLLSRTTLGMVGRETAIGDAIGLAVKKLRERPSDSRALILLTDGDSNAGSLHPRKAAELAKQYHIRIYAIGVGSVDLLAQGLNEEVLREMAELTGGQYFPATDLQALAGVYQHISDNLLKTEVDSRIYLQHTPLYAIPLSFALFLLLIWAWMRVTLQEDF
jgi:Ca-activated chloride channel homolog